MTVEMQDAHQSICFDITQVSFGLNLKCGMTLMRQKENVLLEIWTANGLWDLLPSR